MDQITQTPQHENKRHHPLSLIWWRNKFLAGLAVVIPLAATLIILKFLYRLVSAFFDPLVMAFVENNREHLPGFLIVNDTIPFAALILTILLIVFFGLLVTNVFGQKILLFFEKLLLRVPLVNFIYPLAKQVVDSIKQISKTANHPDPADARQVVYIRYPGLNGFLLAFQTGRFRDRQGREFVSVFIPTAPNPITGFVLIFDENDVLECDLSMEDAWKLLVSAGFVTPLRSSVLPPATETTITGTTPPPVGTIQTD